VLKWKNIKSYKQIVVEIVMLMDFIRLFIFKNAALCIPFDKVSILKFLNDWRRGFSNFLT